MLSTATIAIPAALLSCLLGTILAVCLAKTNLPARYAFLALMIGLYLLPLHLVAAGWLAALGDLGWFTKLTTSVGDAAWLDGPLGAIWVHAVGAVPAVTLLIVAGLRLIDPAREEQALLEGGPLHVIMKVTLPQALPVILGAFGWVLIICSTEISVTDLFGVRTFAEEVYTQAALGTFDIGHEINSELIGFVGAVGLLFLILFVSIISVTRFVRERYELGTVPPWRVNLGSQRFTLLLLVGLLLILIAGVPIGSLIYQAGVVATPTESGWARGWSAPKLCGALAEAPWQHRRELQVSLLLALGVASLSLVGGILVAWLLRPVRRGSLIAWAMIALLLAAPGPVVGLLAIRLFNQPFDSSLGWLGMLYSTWAVPLVVQTSRIGPLIVLLLWPTFVSVPSSLLDAARSDGASLLGRLVRIALPLCWPVVLVAWAIAFVLSVGELSATALVVPPGTPPLSVRLLSLLHYGVEDRVAAMSLDLLMVFTVISYVLLRHIPGRLNSSFGSA